MILDEIDLKILRSFCKLKDGEEVKTWKIMKKIFPKGRDKENQLVKRRITKMSKHGLFSVDENYYALDCGVVKHKKMKFDGKYVESVCFFADGKWSGFEI